MFSDAAVNLFRMAKANPSVTALCCSAVGFYSVRMHYMKKTLYSLEENNRQLQTALKDKKDAIHQRMSSLEEAVKKDLAQRDAFIRRMELQNVEQTRSVDRLQHTLRSCSTADHIAGGSGGGSGKITAAAAVPSVPPTTSTGAVSAPSKPHLPEAVAVAAVEAVAAVPTATAHTYSQTEDSATSAISAAAAYAQHQSTVSAPAARAEARPINEISFTPIASPTVAHADSHNAAAPTSSSSLHSSAFASHSATLEHGGASSSSSSPSVVVVQPMDRIDLIRDRVAQHSTVMPAAFENVAMNDSVPAAAAAAATTASLIIPSAVAAPFESAETVGLVTSGVASSMGMGPLTVSSVDIGINTIVSNGGGDEGPSSSSSQ